MNPKSTFSRVSIKILTVLRTIFANFDAVMPCHNRMREFMKNDEHEEKKEHALAAFSS
jgi:hypothetical protein